jgi:hypothetical protein
VAAPAVTVRRTGISSNVAVSRKLTAYNQVTVTIGIDLDIME